VNSITSASNVSSLTNDLSSSSSNEKNVMVTSPASGDEQEVVLVPRPLFTPGDAPSAAGSANGSKKTWCTSKEVQRKHAIKARQRHRDKIAMKQATVLIVRNNQLPIDHPEKIVTTAIVAATNARLNANLSAKTASEYVRHGLIGASPLKRGPISEFEKRVYKALQGAFVTYLKLEQAGTKKQSTIKDLLLLVNGCVNKAGFTKTRDDLTRRLKRETADHFTVGKANVVEQRWLMWTTQYNLEVCGLTPGVIHLSNWALRGRSIL
jgi:hypothetical protein